MPHIVVDMNDQRPIWARPDSVEARIRAALPDGLSAVFLDTPVEGTGDGSTAAHPAVLEAVADARVYMGFGIAEEVLKAGPGLEWVHTGSAGVGSSLTPEMRRRDIVLTNTAGIHGPPMAEAVIGMMLHFSRGFDLARRVHGRWETAPFYAEDAPLVEIDGSTVGIVGYGGIGHEVGRRAASLGARVLGLTRSEPDAARRAAAGEGVELVHGEAGFRRILAESRFVVVTAPDTEETRGMFDAAAFDAMRSDAVFINVARGAIADEAALLAALRTGRIRGAGLDVFSREPLPDDSPFWELGNVLITPHVSPVTRRFWDRQTDLILHNLECWLEDRPLDRWRNVVDKRAGY